MKKIIFITLFLFIIPGVLSAQVSDRERFFVKANSYYSSEQYDLALDFYKQIENSGLVSFELYYNIGNCYYRLGQIGKAIQYWEKAKQLNPRDPQVNHNLELARLQITDKMVLPEPFFLIQAWWDLRDILGVSRSFRLSGYFLMITLLFVFISRVIWKKRALKRVANPFIIFFSILFILSISLFFNVNHYVKNHQFGILLSKNVEVKSAPHESSNTLFMLHEGSKVQILDQAGSDWYEIAYSEDKRGWVKKKQIGEI